MEKEVNGCVPTRLGAWTKATSAGATLAPNCSLASVNCPQCVGFAAKPYLEHQRRVLHSAPKKVVMEKTGGAPPVPPTKVIERTSRTQGLTPRLFEVTSDLVNWNVPLCLASEETWSIV